MFLHGASTVGESTRVVDLRADEAGWTLALVLTNAAAQPRSVAAELDKGTTSDTTDVDVRTIDGIVPIPRRDGTGGT